MVGPLNLLLGYLWSCFQSHERLKAEIVVLRHQLNVLRRKAPKRPKLSSSDRALFVWLYRLFPGCRRCHHHHPPRDRYWLASSGVSGLVALEVP